MKILIVEDERPAAERLISLLRKTEFPVEILGITESVEKTVNWLSSHPDPDLILMDIQLEDGISFEIFELIRLQVPVIFTTAYDAYALKAFKVNSIDYLLKPFELPDIERALHKYEHLYVHSSPAVKDWSGFLEQVAQSRKERFLVRAGEKYRSVATGQVASFQSEEGCTFLKTFAGQQYDVDYTLEQLEKVLNPGHFFRVSRSWLVNIDAIAEVIPLSGNKLKIRLKSETSPDGILVSRDRIQGLKKWMDR